MCFGCSYYIHSLDIVKRFLKNFFFSFLFALDYVCSILLVFILSTGFSQKFQKSFSKERDPAGVSLDVRTVKREFVLV